MNWENVRYENFVVPVFKLRKGVDKLLQYGLPTFFRYAEEVGLSYCDINRVISKVRIAHGRTDLKEIPCPPELRQRRLNCYVKNYRYSVKKAQEMIKEIDSMYYGDQPIPDPGDIEKLASGVLRGV